MVITVNLTKWVLLNLVHIGTNLHLKCVPLLLLYKYIVLFPVGCFIVSYKFPSNTKEKNLDFFLFFKEFIFSMENKSLQVICGCIFTLLLHIDISVAWVRSMSSHSTGILLPLQVLGRRWGWGLQDLLGACVQIGGKKGVAWQFLCNHWRWQCSNL